MVPNSNYDILIGIDTGVNTGFAIYDRKKKQLTEVSTLPIHQAMEAVENVVLANEGYRVKVRFEDARLRKMFGNSGREKLQGAGSIKRDAKIWEDYLKDKGIAYEAVAPKDNKTKLPPAVFKAMTKWTQQTTNHSRDAAMLVYGF